MNIKDAVIVIFLSVLLFSTTWLWLSPQGLSKAPDVTFRLTDGRILDLQEIRGIPVLVTFWATSCTGCVREMPHLISLYEDFSRSGFEIIGVAMAYDPPSHVMQMIESKKIPYPIALDIDGSIAESFDHVSLTPTSFLIAPDGRIIQHRIGEMNMESLRKQIIDLLPQEQQATNHKPLVAHSL